MRRRSSTTGLMIYTYCILQETVGVLADPDRGVDMFTSEHATRIVASRRRRVVRSRSELVSAPPGLVS